MSTLLNESTVQLAPSCSSREKLLALESSCKEQPQVSIPLQNYFAGGVYARTGVIPKGTLLVGKIHKEAQINIVLSGTIQVATEEGVKTLTAPHIFVSPAGTKRAGLALTDVMWATLHGTDSEDLDEIESEFIAKSYEELDNIVQEVNHVGSNSSGSDGRRKRISSTPRQKSTEESATTSN